MTTTLDLVEEEEVTTSIHESVEGEMTTMTTTTTTHDLAVASEILANVDFDNDIDAPEDVVDGATLLNKMREKNEKISSNRRVVKNKEDGLTTRKKTSGEKSQKRRTNEEEDPVPFAQKKQPQMISEASVSAESEVHQSIAISTTVEPSETVRPSCLFLEELKKTPFSIFTPLSNLGCYSWHPKGGYTSIERMSSTDDLLRFICFDEQMASLLPVVEMPKNVPFQPAQNVIHYMNNYPYGGNEIAS